MIEDNKGENKEENKEEYKRDEPEKEVYYQKQ